MPQGLNRILIAFVVTLLVAGGTAMSWQWHRRHPGELRRRTRERWRRLRTRWDAPAYLVVHFLVGLGLCLTVLTLFSLITVGVQTKQRVTLFDQYLADLIHRHATDVGITMARFTSALGDARLLAAVLALGTVLLWLRRRRLALVGWITAFVGAAVLHGGMQIIFRRTGPVWNDPFAGAIGLSFPSGHVLGALVAWGMLTWLILSLGRRRPRTDLTAAITLGTLVGSIAFSRIYLGLHFLSDVLAGITAGCIWLATCVAAIEASEGDADRRAGERRVAPRTGTSDRRGADRRHVHAAG